ncbi:hypothetical protein FVF72_06130 [Methanothermobacter sp. KEPCO-1]|uniref:hypothetical protein n=1 Tax=Methanothermobacter sp. KEPCO-1 TaxID=2603820 RepID=UPI0011CC902D|nr:hypothetical protein [Methanothermobacter sp. KEPCO-1]QEF94765.1 hypothetical protein FVF72_06130 [Methanothermobacter sp. KEPCO-1]
MLAIKNFGRNPIPEYKTFESLRKNSRSFWEDKLWVLLQEYNFVHVMSPLDIIVASNGASGVLGIGIVRGDYIPSYESAKLGLHEIYGISSHLRKWNGLLQILYNRSL